MRKTHLYLLGAMLIAFISLTGCNKAANPATNNSNPTGGTSGTLLTAAIGFDTLHTSGQDTTDKTLLTYDGAKRLHTIAFFYYDTLGVFQNEQITTYAYSGSSIYPSSSSTYDLATGTSTSTYTFDIAGHLLHEKDVQPNTDSTVTTFYTSGGTYNTSIDYSSGTVNSMDTVYYQQTLSGNNIATAVLSTNYDNSSYNNVFNYTVVTYDTHKNPFVNIKFMEMSGEANGGDAQSGYFGGWAFSTNNVTSYQDTWTDVPSGVNPETFNTSSFIYNSDDYPVSFRYNSTGAGEPYKAGKNLFYYTN
jgi:hypothetical protein